MEVIFSNRAYAAVLSETTEKIQTETGGLFLGSVVDNVWYIIESIDPGPNSIFEVAYFEYDQAYTQHLIRKIANLYSSKLDLIGLWHRHPGSFDIFSSTDDTTNSKYALMRDEGAISALVNIDPNFRLTMYHVGQPCRYSKVKYDVGDEKIPRDLLKLKSQEKFFNMMHSHMSYNKANIHETISFCDFMQYILPYLKEYTSEGVIHESQINPSETSDKILDAIFEDITFLSEEMNIELSLSQRGKCIVMLQDYSGETTRVYFYYSEEDDTVYFEYKGKNYIYTISLFKKSYEKFTNDKDVDNNEEQTTLVDDLPIDGKPKNITNMIKKFFGGEQ